MMHLLAFSVLVLFLGAGPASADPVSGWIIAQLGIKSVIGAALVRIGVSIATSMLANVLLRQKQTAKSPGITTETTTAGDTTPQTFILGRYATAGNLVAPYYSKGRAGDGGSIKNAYRYVIQDVGDLPVTGLARLWVDGKSFTPGDTLVGDLTGPGGATPDPEKRKKYNEGSAPNLRVWFYDGTQTAVSPALMELAEDHKERPWSADMVGRDVPYFIASLEYDPDVWQGQPSILAEIDGIALPDPRAGSDVYTHNPVVMIRALLSGIPLPGGETYGLDVAEGDLPDEWWLPAMDACDEPVTVKRRPRDPGTGVYRTEPRYRAAYEVAMATAENGGETPLDVVDELLAACSGQIADIGGQWIIRVGAPGLPAASITDDDILRSSPQELDPYRGMAETYNAVRATYPDPDEQWQAKEAPPRYDLAAEAEDGQRLVADLRLNAVPYHAQVQRLMEAWLKDARRMRRHTIVLPPEYGYLLPLDTLSWDSERNGYEGKLFEVTEVAHDPRTLSVTLSLREVDPADYDWTPEFQLPDEAPSAEVVETQPTTLPGLAVEPVTITDAAGQGRRPGIRLSWSTPLPGVRAVTWRVRVAATGAIVATGSTADVGRGEAVLSEGLLAATAYEVQVDGDSSLIAPSAWISVTTPDVRLGEIDFDGVVRDALAAVDDLVEDVEQEVADRIAAVQALAADLAQEVQDRAAQAQAQADALAEVAGDLAQEAQDRATAVQAQADALAAEQGERLAQGLAAGERMRDLLGEVEALRDYAADLDYSAYSRAEELRRRIGAVVEGYAASFDERITTAASTTGAVAERVTVLEVEGDALAASITAVETALVSETAALAQMVAALSVGNANAFDQAAIWYFDASVEGWTGSPSAPTIAATGYLRPPEGSGSSIVSPAGLAIEAARYEQVRLRLRRAGAPAWTGHLWWRGDGQVWDAARRVTVAEPAWSDGAAAVTFAPPWSGTVDQIRLDLAAAPTGSAYVEADWIAIGRPAPGPSSRALDAIEVRVDEAEGAIVAQGLAITGLESAIAGKADASAVTALETRVEETEDGLSAASSAITAIETALPGKASVAAVDALTTLIEDAGLGNPEGVSVGGQQIAGIRATLLPLASEGVDADFAAHLAAMQGREIVADASRSLSTRIDQTDASLTVVSQAVTEVQAVLPGLASASALDALTTRVSVTEGGISTQAGAITALAATVAGKADASALSSLTTRVDAAEGAITSQGAAITSLQNALPGKASATALETLTTRVTETEDAIEAQAEDLTSLQTTLGEKADASAVTALTTRVTAAEDVNTTQAGQITALQTSVAGKASIAALDALDTRVEETEAGLTAQGSAITSLQTAVAGKANTTALTALTTRVTTAEGTISTHTGQITSLNTAVAGKANASAVTALDARVEQAEEDIDAQSSAITSLQNALPGKADASALTALTTRVTAAEDVNTTQAGQITSLNTTVAGKASTSALNAIDTRVDAAEGAITSQGSAITALQNSVATKASTTAVTALTTRVEATEAGITATSASVLGLQSALDRRQLVRSPVFAGDLGGLTIETADVVPIYFTTASVLPADKRAMQVTIPAGGQVVLRLTVPAVDLAGRIVRVTGRVNAGGSGRQARLGALRQASISDPASYDSLLGEWVVLPGVAYQPFEARLTIPDQPYPVYALRLFLGGPPGTTIALTDLLFEDATVYETTMAAISDVAATRVTASGAVAAVNTAISATYQDVTALAQATAFAEATVDGIASGFVWRLGGANVLSLVRVEDGAAPATKATLNAAQIEITGDLIVNGAVSRRGFSGTVAGGAPDIAGGTEASPLWLSNEIAFTPAAYTGDDNPVIWEFAADATPLSNAPVEFRVLLYGRIVGTSTWQPVDTGTLMMQGRFPVNTFDMLWPFASRRADYAGAIRRTGAAPVYDRYRVGAYRVSTGGSVRLTRINTILQQINR